MFTKSKFAMHTNNTPSSDQTLETVDPDQLTRIMGGCGDHDHDGGPKGPIQKRMAGGGVE